MFKQLSSKGQPVHVHPDNVAFLEQSSTSETRITFASGATVVVDGLPSAILAILTAES